MVETSPERRRGWWGSTRRAIGAALSWSPHISPTAMIYVRVAAIGAFGLDVALLIAIHYHWIGGGWRTFRQWEDAAALALMNLWVWHAIQSRRNGART